MSRQSWTNEEDQAIIKLVKDYGIQDWTKIASRLKDQYTILKRTGKQCRERWYNHLSPNVNKKPWTCEEELKLFKMHRNEGNRWKDISKSFVGRTDNDIKNHFYSTLRRSLRRLNKILGEKNSTTQMREIKPSVLSTIMNHIYDQEQLEDQQLLQSLRDLPILIFQFANFKPIKDNLKKTNIEDVRHRTSQIFILINKFNQEYEQKKINRFNYKHLKKNPSGSKSLASTPISPKKEIKRKSSIRQITEENNEEIKVSKDGQFNEKEYNFDDEKVNENERHLQKTQFSLDHQGQCDGIKIEEMEEEVHEHNNNCETPKLQFKEIREKPRNRTISLESQEMLQIEFEDPEEPSELNIHYHSHEGDRRLEREAEWEEGNMISNGMIEEVLEGFRRG